VQSGEVKEGMDLSLLFLHRQGLAGRPHYAGPPDLPFAGLQSALGSLPSVALSSAGANWVCSLGFNCASMGMFPVTVSLGGLSVRKGKRLVIAGALGVASLCYRGSRRR